jgi:hypothetical protein
MTGTIDDALPWPESDQNTESNTAETTPGGQDSTRWVEVAVNLMPGEAAIIKSRLESENIPVYLKQEAIGSVLGLTVGTLGSAKILVPDSLAERAADILAETFDVDDEIDWQ